MKGFMMENTSLINTEQLNIEVAIIEDGSTTILKADGILLEFDTEIGPKGLWHCMDIIVTNKAIEFESTVYFYMDWLEDIINSFPKIDVYVLHYMLFAHNIEQDLTMED